MVMVFNATFNNISVVSWRWVLLVEETGEPGEYRRVVDKSLDKFNHIISEIRTHNVSGDMH
jgi:hypothetical protein